MTDRLLPDLPAPSAQITLTATPLPKAYDESLLFSATSRWRQSSQDLRDLFSLIPTTRNTLVQLLEQQLDLGEPGIGLMFPAANEHPERLVNLIDALAYVFQHPQLQADLDERCRVVGLPPSHALFNLSPRQLLERLKGLDLQRALTVRWNTYWDARAPGTPLSRWERAKQLYLDHIEASAQVAFAQRSLSAEQLKPLLALLDYATTATPPDNPPVNIEQLALVLSNGSRVKLPGTRVISRVDQPAEQSLYLSITPVAIQGFAQRSDMETWLAGQNLVPAGLPQADLRVEYTRASLPLADGMAELLDNQLAAQIVSLRNGNPRTAPDLAEHASQALTHADRMDRQRATTTVLALPPDTVDSLLDVAPDELPSLFGSLHADIPWARRQMAVRMQRDALQTHLGDDPEGAPRQPFKDWLDILQTAEQRANTAASRLLSRVPEPGVVAFKRDVTAMNQLHQAHKSALDAEAWLQLTLKQLSEDQYRLLDTLLNTPNEGGSDQVAASLTLSMSERDGEQVKVSQQALNGPFVLTHPQVLLDADSPHGLLLYWPGTGGGLQSFANRRELERQVFSKPDSDSDLTLQMKKISGDPLQYGLDKLVSDFEAQSDAIHLRLAETAQVSQRDDELRSLRERTLAALEAPVNAARSLAYSHLQEQDNSGILATHLPDWLKKISVAERTRLKLLIKAYIQAMRRSHELLTVDLPARDDFTRQRLHARLRKDFLVEGGFSVQIEMPDVVTWSRELVPGAAPGTPQRPILVPSVERQKQSLEDLAQHNIDNTPSMALEPYDLRLRFMTVEVTTTDEVERQTLTEGITLAYLKKALPELDLPKAYETLIYDTFMSKVNEAHFVKEHRRECLTEPWRLMLKLQGECARLQQQINDEDLRILNIAIDADTPHAWLADRKQIVMLPAYLSAGGKDTPNEGPVTLSGVLFIQEQVSGVTLLYLSDSPDNQFLRRYDSLEDARMALFKLCVRNEMVSYLAGRALEGNVRAHESRITQAVLNHFDAMIGVGVRWPASTSLAAHLLNAHMGRLIEAHRGTSRSNDALYMERYALEGPRAFNYMKMALGVVPFVGVAVGLYDAWTSTNQAVAAFLRGDVGDGLVELEAVLMSLIDAGMDLVPGELAGDALSTMVRGLTRTRQLRKLIRNVAALNQISTRQARQVVARFTGYEYDLPISLSGLQPATHGIYRNVYRHADGDFIVRQGRIYRIERSLDSRNWRLSGTRKKTYKQPIALDESGQWNTWFGVYGTTFEGGGLGGGAVLGHMADALDPIWPQAIRQRLPRWWADRAFRRHHQLTEAADDLAMQLNVRTPSSNAAIRRYNDATKDLRPALRSAAETAAIGDIEVATRHYQTLAELLPLTHGNKRRVLLEIQSEDAYLVTDRFHHRVFYGNHRVGSMLDRIETLLDSLDDLPADAFTDRPRIWEETRKLRVQVLSELDQIGAAMEDVNLWLGRITNKSEKAKLTPEVTMLNGRLSEANLLYLKTAHRMEIINRFDNSLDVSWFYLQGRAQNLRAKVDRALSNQHNLGEVNATKAQRNQILQECLDIYSQFSRDMNVWTSSYPQHFHLDAVEPLMSGIGKMAEQARKGIALPPPAAPARRSNKKVFTTEDDQLLIGEERLVPTTQTRQYSLTGKGGHTEIWEQGPDGKSRFLNPRPSATAPTQHDLKALVTNASQRLERQTSYLNNVRDYAKRDMLPVDLEHMMVSEAEELSRRALRIEELEAQNSIIQQLRDKADELRSTGREMRTRQTLSIKKPTDGMLDDLISQNAVRIRKTDLIQNLGKRKDGRTDFMQEYKIYDLTQTPARLLWYAHFHYSSPAPLFHQFEKAHLKLPEHRFLTHADDASLPYAPIEKKSLVLTHFENL